MELTIQQVNDILANYNSLNLVTQHEEDDDEYSSRTEIRETKISGLFIRIDYQSDSYGDNEQVVSLKLVKPITKTVTDYE